MDTLIIRKKISITQSLAGLLVLFVGFYLATNNVNSFFTALSPYSLMISGLLAFTICFKKEGITSLFSMPKDPKGNIKNFFKYLILTATVSVISALLLQYVFHFSLASNELSGKLGSIIYRIPFMLLGEELISFYILLVTSNFIFSKNNNIKQAEFFGIFISSIVFGLLHFSTYYNGNPYTTLLHILLIQGSVRVVFNLSGLRSNSIWLPLLIHITFDIITLSIS